MSASDDHIAIPSSSLESSDPNLAMEMMPRQRADMEFDIEILPLNVVRRHPEYRDRVRGMVEPPQPAVCAILKCETRIGPFVFLRPFDARLALRTPDLVKGLVEEAQEQLARRFAELAASN